VCLHPLQQAIIDEQALQCGTAGTLDDGVMERREFLKSGGALIVGFSVASPYLGQERPPSTLSRPSVAGPPDQKLIDTWIAIHADSTATVFIGFVELGQGTSTALLQIAADELDLDMNQISSVRLDTHVTPNQGATVASASIDRGGPQIRAAAAEARLALLTLASTRLNAPLTRLTVSKGVISVIDDAARSVKYGELLGDRPFNVPFTGTAPQKPVGQYQVVGTRVPRRDLPDKVSGKYVYVQHVRLPGMLHGRIVRPKGQGAYADGARVVSVDEASIQDIPGVRIVRVRDFIGVVSVKEWDAVRAAQQLKVTWEVPASLPGDAGLYDQMRAARTIDTVIAERGDTKTALERAAHVVTATYRGPYQAHAPFAPNCAVADATSDPAVVMCSTQSVYGTRDKVAAVLGVPPGKVRVEYYEGAGTFGRSCFDDAAEAAAIMSKAAGRPVRTQFMRWDEHGWDNYGPPHLAEVVAGIDATGKIVTYEYHGWQHVWSTIETSEQLALGTRAAESADGTSRNLNQVVLGSMYDIPNVRLVNHQVPGVNGYLKASNLRSPLDVSFAFASEQAIDDLAHAAGLDPIELRRRNVSDARWLGVLDAVAKAGRWTPRVAASGASATNRARIVTGRGVALGTHLVSYGAAIAEIRVDKSTGQVVATHMYGALDAGLAVNPALVENQISGQLVQAASRVLKEEVRFSKTNVTTLDWNSYPILRFGEHPDVTAIVVQRAEAKSTGAGEELMAASAAAIANAFFDATGVRLREYPFTPTRVKAALNAQ
jgi:nicotinate dehydrogenase subunit B